MDSKRYPSTPDHQTASLPKYALRNSSTPVKKNLKFGEDNGRKSRKRKRMTNIINNIEKEIEEQLEKETIETDFLSTDVLAIVKEVIRDDDIKEMVRNMLHPGDRSICYEPKLTRAKVRQLLKVRPDLSLPIVWPMRAQNTNFVSECLSLINEDFSENSSEDEEYKPDDDDKSEYSFKPSECGESEAGFNDSFDIFGPRSVDTDASRLEIEENIGQRTRSKLPLTETPLEVIEQRFQPPDITIDMYETECDNEEWRHFIQASVQPIDYLASELPDDLDDDPEYVVQADEETVDKEELRKDKAVEVPADEVEELILELIRANEMFPNTSATADTSFLGQQSNICEDSDSERPEKDDAPVPITVSKPKIPVSDCPAITTSQRSLLDQQIRQHVQLTLTHFLQCYKHPTLFRLADEMKTNLECMRTLSGFNTKSAFYASNLDDALKVAEKWEEIHADVPRPTNINFMKTRRKKLKKRDEFAPEFMKIVSKSKAFLYPLMLPKVPFDSGIERNIHRRDILPSEEWLLASGLEQFTEHVRKTGKSTTNVMWESLKLIVHYLLPHFTPTFLYRVIKTRLSEEGDNYLKHYFDHKRVPPLKHYIIPVFAKPVCQQSFALLHPVWEEYIRKNFLIITPVPNKEKEATTSGRRRKKIQSGKNVSGGIS